MLTRWWSSFRERGRRTRIVKEGGYQPTRDPGPVPEVLVRRSDDGGR